MREEISRELFRRFGETEPITEIVPLGHWLMVFTAHRTYKVRQRMRRLDPTRLPH